MKSMTIILNDLKQNYIHNRWDQLMENKMKGK